MADLTITASQVLPVGTSFPSELLLAGAAITAGDALYKDASSLWQLADANVSAVEANASAIALNDAAVSQPVRGQTGGTITLGAGAAPAAGEVYCVSATAGNIAPDADITTGLFKTILGVGIGSNNVILGFLKSGVASA